LNKEVWALQNHKIRRGAGHACGFALANKGHDTEALQAYLGYRNIQRTVRYTELTPDRFKDFWRSPDYWVFFCALALVPLVAA